MMSPGISSRLFAISPRKRIRIFDTQFAHVNASGSCHRDVHPTFFDWTRRGKRADLAFFTETSASKVFGSAFKTKIAWLMESPAVYPDRVNFVLENLTEFDYVLTHDVQLTETDERFLFCPVGGCWIRNEDWRIYDKTKGISIVASEKNTLEGQKLRHSVIERFGDRMELFGRGYKPVEHKIDALKDYAFSIVIENCRQDGYFTEKLIDAFACGTIPIYWGCPSIGKFFDIDGIITFDSIEQLDEILSRITMEDYHDRLAAVQHNFETARQYRLAEDWMWRNYQTEIFST